MARFTPVEQRIDDLANRVFQRAPHSRAWAAVVEFLVFGAKQAWACLFGALLLTALVIAHLAYPDRAALDRNDLLTIVAIVIQLGMVLGRLETLRELRVIVLFHVVGTVMELFKTDVGSWAYPPGGVLHLGNVPLFSGFMYAAVGSYMVRVFRLFELRFDRYPPRWITVVIAVGIYANFFTHHYIVDLRWIFVAAIVALYWTTWMQARVFRIRLRMPLLVAFVLVAFFIWIAENIGTGTGTWLYPSQRTEWQPVSIAKLGSWFLLMMISVVLVTWVYPPEPPGPPADGEPDSPASSASSASAAAGEAAAARASEGTAET